MGKEGGIVFDYSMADDIKCHENTVGSHGLMTSRTNQAINIASKPLLVSGFVV